METDRKSFIVCIGNSDDKLTQLNWAQYVEAVNNEILDWEYDRHFFGFSLPTDPWQNATWVFEYLDDEDEVETIEDFKNTLASIAKNFNQDSILLSEFDPAFIKG